ERECSCLGVWVAGQSGHVSGGWTQRLGVRVIRSLRFVVRAFFLILLLRSGRMTAAIALPCMNRRVQDAVTKAWSCCLMLVCGVKVVRHGAPIMSGPVLWVANHVSWIDIFILNSWRATSFIAKQEIRRWPVIGWLVA